jgi:hypothetical protein
MEEEEVFHLLLVLWHVGLHLPSEGNCQTDFMRLPISSHVIMVLYIGQISISTCDHLAPLEIEVNSIEDGRQW